MLSDKQEGESWVVARFVVWLVCWTYAMKKAQWEHTKLMPANLFEVNPYMDILIKLTGWPTCCLPFKESFKQTCWLDTTLGYLWQLSGCIQVVLLLFPLHVHMWDHCLGHGFVYGQHGTLWNALLLITNPWKSSSCTRVCGLCIGLWACSLCTWLQQHRLL